LVLDLAEGLPPAHVDPNQLELALLNLAVNGRDAMAGDGQLTIAVTLDQPPPGSRLKPGSYIRLSVSDNGIGMDEETLRRAPEPFFTTKGIGRGTGLGLASVHGLAEQSGGEFKLESKPGSGTTALIWLPVSDQISTAKSSVEPSTDWPKANDIPVLLVDDEELVRAGTADMLKDEGYAVTQASSGFEALRLLQDGLDVQVLITDFAMPGMTGVDLAREAAALRPGLQVLLITGYANVSDHEAAGLARLAKPFKQSDLAGSVAELLQRKHVINFSSRSPQDTPRSRAD
jgi:CheY-like chemotaxis protein